MQNRVYFFQYDSSSRFRSCSSRFANGYSCSRYISSWLRGRTDRRVPISLHISFRIFMFAFLNSCDTFPKYIAGSDWRTLRNAQRTNIPILNKWERQDSNLHRLHTHDRVSSNRAVLGRIFVSPALRASEQSRLPVSPHSQTPTAITTTAFTFAQCWRFRTPAPQSVLRPQSCSDL